MTRRTCRSGRRPAAILLSDAALRRKLFLLACVCARLDGLPAFLACVTVMATPPSSPAATPMVFELASPDDTRLLLRSEEGHQPERHKAGLAILSFASMQSCRDALQASSEF